MIFGLPNIQSIDEVHQVCTAYFYVPVNTSANPVKYRRESCGHRSKEAINWNSLILLALQMEGGKAHIG